MAGWHRHRHHAGPHGLNDTTNEEWGLLTGHHWGPLTGHQWVLFHGHGQQPYYVFPWPDWTGDLESEALMAGIAPTELAYKRSGPDWWFAGWMVVLTTAQVVQVLSGELAAHGSSTRKGASCRLVRFDLSAGTGAPTRIWGAHAAEPLTVPWRRFWTDLQACGRDGWPQLIRVPVNLVKKANYRRAEVRGLLASSLPFMAETRERNVEFMTLGPSDETPANEPDVFVAMQVEPDRGVDSPGADRVDAGDTDRRQAVFVNAGARQSRD